MKVKLFVYIDCDPISVLYKFQMDMFTNSREIKNQNIEKSLSLIIERSMATKLPGPRKHFVMVLEPEYINWHTIRAIGPVLWPVQGSRT